MSLSMWPLVVMVALLSTGVVPLPVTCLDVAEHHAGLGTSVYLGCQDGVATGPGADHWYQWILPSGEMLSTDDPGSNITKHFLVQDGLVLEIPRLGPQDFGLYICIAFADNVSNTILYTKQHDLVSKPTTGRLGWRSTDYTTKIEIGMAACVVVAIVIGMVCYNYNNQQERLDSLPPRIVTSVQTRRQELALTAAVHMTSETEASYAHAHGNKAFLADPTDQQLQQQTTTNGQAGDLTRL